MRKVLFGAMTALVLVLCAVAWGSSPEPAESATVECGLVPDYVELTNRSTNDLVGPGGCWDEEEGWGFEAYALPYGNMLCGNAGWDEYYAGLMRSQWKEGFTAPCYIGAPGDQ